MLGHHDFDKHHDWTHNNITNDLHHKATSCIHLSRLSMMLQEDNLSLSNSSDSLSPTQCMSFDVVISHFRNTTSAPSLKMVIQGTTGTGKSYLISCLKYALQTPCEQSGWVLLLLAPTGVATFNIHASTIHSSLRIPIGEMQPLEGQSLSKLQEELCHICYILIDEMSFIGPKMLTQIDVKISPQIVQCHLVVVP